MELLLEVFIQVLMENGSEIYEIHDKPSIGSWKLFYCFINCSVNYKSLTPWKTF